VNSVPPTAAEPTVAPAPAPRPPLVLAHRGGAREAPENTLAAFRHAVAAGADGVELDVRLSADGVPVLFHDEDLGRFSRDTRRLDEVGAAELAATDLGRRRPRFRGERVPTLAEALAVVAPLALVDLELKPTARGEALVAAVVAAVAAAGLAARTVVTSFDTALLAALARRAPDLARGAVLDASPADDAWLDHPLVSLSLPLARAGLAERARRAGRRVLVWTENDPRRLALWQRLGVEAVITDRPARFAAHRAR
jgi:glycerophosphoryl diester phosphodiesterase